MRLTATNLELSLRRTPSPSYMTMIIASTCPTGKALSVGMKNFQDISARGRGQQIRRRDARDGPIGLGEAGALERHLLRAAVMVPARADGDAGLTIHSASLRK